MSKLGHAFPEGSYRLVVGQKFKRQPGALLLPLSFEGSIHDLHKDGNGSRAVDRVDPETQKHILELRGTCSTLPVAAPQTDLGVVLYRISACEQLAKRLNFVEVKPCRPGAGVVISVDAGEKFTRAITVGLEVEFEVWRYHVYAA